MRPFLRWALRPRYSPADVAVIASGATLGVCGHPWFALLLVTAGSLAALVAAEVWG